jgi:hypothetical protein
MNNDGQIISEFAQDVGYRRGPAGTRVDCLSARNVWEGGL